MVASLRSIDLCLDFFVFWLTKHKDLPLTFLFLRSEMESKLILKLECGVWKMVPECGTGR